MHRWFVYLFEERMDAGGFVTCFECGGKMHEDVYKENTCCYSHLIEKGKYKQYAGDPDNVVLTHPDCHTLYTLKPTQAVNQYAAMLEYKKLKQIT